MDKLTEAMSTILVVDDDSAKFAVFPPDAVRRDASTRRVS
jgi:hypothetical protein